MLNTRRPKLHTNGYRFNTFFVVEGNTDSGTDFSNKHNEKALGETQTPRWL